MYFILLFLWTCIESANGAKRGLLVDWTTQNANPNIVNQIPTNAQIVRIGNWNTWKTANSNDRFPFVPTIRGLGQLQGQEWDWAWNANGPEVQYLNEPERAGISPELAAQKWYEQMVPLRKQKGKKLVGPSCANDDAGKAWLDRFMNLVKSERPNYLGLHIYETDGNRAIQYLQAMYQKYQLPIWLTEFASISRNYADVLYFTAQLCNYMDATWWVDKYWLFGFMPRLADGFVSPAAQLLNSDCSFRDLMMKYMWDSPIVASTQAITLGTGQNAYR